MMEGKLREYNWRDIERLIYKDVGLTNEEQRRTRGELWCVGGFSPPKHDLDTMVRVHVYDKTFSDRIREHAGEE